MKIRILATGFLLFWFTIIQGATITTNKSSYIPKENITVAFSSATTKTDWIGMYRSPTTPGPQNSLGWLYLNGTQTVPSGVVESGTLYFTAPAIEGSYKICFHPNDGYAVLNTVNFSVSKGKAAPQAAFFGSTFSVAPGGTVNFTDQSMDAPTSWSWSFPGGLPSESSLQNPFVKYNEAGIYTVSLTVSNANGSNQLVKTGYITVSDLPDTTTDLNIMNLNVWVEGTSVPNGKTYIRDIIASVNPDVVCLVENRSQDWAAQLVNDLAEVGKYYNLGHINGSDASVLSKFPITSSGPLLKSTVSIFNLDVNGNNIVIAAAHLDYSYYASYLPRGYRCGGSAPYNGWSQMGSPDPLPVTDLSIISEQNLGSQRDEQIGAFVDYIANETRPVIILGDFNEPSGDDWTVNQANMFDHNGVIFDWNTVKLLKSNDFIDAFREIYTDEVLNPGITWPSFATGVGSTSWTPKSDERERIDYIFYRGAGVKAINAAIVGPRNSYVKNELSDANTENDHFLADTLPWPSDHKGVFATISIPKNSDSTNVSVNIFPERFPFEITVFPNPGSENLNFISSVDVSAQVSILNSTGKEVFRKNMQLLSNGLNTLDISHVSTGIYFLRVVSPGNFQTIKIVKK